MFLTKSDGTRAQCNAISIVSRHRTLVIDTPIHSKTEMSLAIIIQEYLQPKIARGGGGTPIIFG